MEFGRRLDLHNNIHHEWIRYHNILMRILEALQDPLKLVFSACDDSMFEVHMVSYEVSSAVTVMSRFRSFGSIRSIAAILNK
jgi:hypothetical protein